MQYEFGYMVIHLVVGYYRLLSLSKFLKIFIYFLQRIRKAGALVRQAWGIGKRRFAGDWERRIWLYERLVGMVMEYDEKIWAEGSGRKWKRCRRGG